MTDKQLKKMSRKELLEMMVLLSEENEELKKELEDAKTQLNDRRIIIDRAGTLAEAVVGINGVIEAVQAACDQYAYNVKIHCQELKQEAKRRCEQMINDIEKRVGENE